MQKVPTSIKLDDPIKADIDELLPGSDFENPAQFMRHLFRQGIKVEKARRRLITEANLPDKVALGAEARS